jgi:hypothetical protein
MKTCDQNDIVHTLDPQSTLLGEGEPGVDMLNNPVLERILRKSVFASSIYWEG